MKRFLLLGISLVTLHANVAQASPEPSTARFLAMEGLEVVLKRVGRPHASAFTQEMVSPALGNGYDQLSWRSSSFRDVLNSGILKFRVTFEF